MEPIGVNFREKYTERMLAALGKITVEKVEKSTIIIINLRAVGVELAKNLCLLSPKKITLIDDTIVTDRDLIFNPLITESDIGRHRSEALVEKLNKVTNFVTIESLPRSVLTEDFLKQYDLFIATDFFDRPTLEEWNIYCRRNRVGFIHANCIGTFQSLFVDFNNMKVFDRLYHGRNVNFYIESITNDRFGHVTISKNQPHFLKDGDFVTIHEVEGMTEVNGDDPRPIRVIDEYNFTIENTTRFGKYTRGGFVAYEKVPFTISFSSFANSLSNPRLINIPPSKFSQEELHATLLLYYDWFSEMEENPTILNGKSNAELEEIAMELYTNNIEVNMLHEEHEFDSKKIINLLVTLMSYGDFQLPPVATFIGSVASFQCIPSTGKFMPINQMFYLNFDEFPEIFLDFLKTKNLKSVMPFFSNPVDSTVKDISKLKIGIFGCGSKGIEVCKLLYLLGITTHQEGSLWLFDDSKISVPLLQSSYVFK